MKRLITASLCAGFLFTPVALAQTPTRQHQRQYTHLYQSVRQKFGVRAPGRQILKWGLAPGKKASDADLVKSIEILNRMLTPAPAVTPTATSTSTSTVTPSRATVSAAPVSSSYPSGGGYANVPGVPASFAACVALKESTDGAGSSNIYGILGSGGQGSLAQQKAAFSSMYAQRGTQPWAPYDGC